MIFKPRTTVNNEFCNTSQLPLQANAVIMNLSIHCLVGFFSVIYSCRESWWFREPDRITVSF